MEKADFKRSLAAWAAAEAGEHPPAETLRDGRDGRLAAGEREALEAHLLVCGPCFDLARDLEAFSRARRAAAAPTVADFEAAAFWRTLKPRLEARPARPRLGRWRLPTAVAATALVTALGFSFWVTSQQRVLAESQARIAALQAPRPNARVYDLYLDTSERSGESVPQSVEVPAGSMLILTPHDAGDFPEYAVEIYDAAGSQAWAGGGFVPDPADGTFTLWLPPELLPPGDYRVRLVGRGADTREPIEEYGVRMVR